MKKAEKKKFSLYGTDFFGNEKALPSKGAISDRFTIAPFSVLTTRDGVWQSRKRRWIALGIDSEIGRGESLSYRTDKDLDVYRKRKLNAAPEGSPIIMGYDKNGKRLVGLKKPNLKRVNGLTFRATGFMADVIEKRGGGTSIFDPVLCELMYKWFCPKHGQIVDPFAGGSVRGIVAHMLNYKYWGCDLRKEQIDANYEQAKKIIPDESPIWIVGDALDKVKKTPKADFIFSCPPYGDLEKYSDDKRDLSNMEYHTFIAVMKRIILRCYKQLNNNRFACFVVGDFRDEKGFYRNFVSDTISCFLDNNFKLYNEIILVTSVGSLPIRITKQFNASRKMGKAHQNILVFAKGNPKIATKVITQ